MEQSNKSTWLLALIALALATVALLARDAQAQGDPVPTMSSTSWALTPGWTPTMHPWPPRTPTPTAYVVWLTEVQR